MRILPLAFLALFLALPAWARSAGDWSSTGGGSGVACFAEVADAMEAESYIASGKILPDRLLQRARLRVLEAWEMEASGEESMSVAVGEDWRAIHRRAQKIFAQAAPLLATRLEIAAGWANFAKWESETNLSLIEDANPIVPLPENCRRLQLVVRYSNGNMIHSVPRGAIEVQVVFNNLYFDLLPPIDQAMLVRHEEFYVLGQAVGHPSSDHIRGLVRLFFSEYIASKTAQDPEPYRLKGEGHALVKSSLIFFFGDYLDLFASLDPLVNAAPFSAYHHLETFKTFLNSTRPAIVACRENGGEFQACTNEFMDPRVLADQLNDEESFLYLSNFGLEQSMNVLNFDYLVTPNVGEEHFQSAMRFACEYIVTLEVVSEVKALQTKALRYCDSWRSQRGNIQGNKSN